MSLRLFLMALLLGGMPVFAIQAQSNTIEKRFSAIDTNRDGKLSAEELRKVPIIEKLLQGADQNGDGFLTLEEVHIKLNQPAKPTEEATPSTPSREAPRVLIPNQMGIGRKVPAVKLTAIDQREIRLPEFLGKNGLLIAFTTTSCPLCKKYAPTLAKLEESLAAKQIPVLFVNPMANEKLEDLQGFKKAHQLRGPLIHDRDGQFAAMLGATSTTEVFLLDPRMTLIYRGAIDDQYGLGYSLAEPKNHYLLDAVSALLNGRRADPAATTAVGCVLDLPTANSETVATTYHNRISRIIQTNCLDCHRAGGVGPFSLETYDDVVANAGMIRKVVDQGTMPPWFAKEDGHAAKSKWVNDRTLPEADKAALLAWLKSDRPVGDSSDAPLPRTYPDGWLIGKPDAIFEFDKPHPIKANGVMDYQNITVETELTEDKWVQALEVRPSAPAVVHHVLVMVLGPKNAKNSRADEASAEERQGFFAAYVPGQSVLSYPEGYAKFLPKGSRLRFQMHYTPNGTATTDSTRIGMIFAKKPPQYEVKVVGIANTNIKIPKGTSRHPEVAKLTVPEDVRILGFLPHMHLRGQAFRYELEKGEAKTATVLDIPNYDFNWQLYYRLAEPKLVPAGTTIKATGWFDNSAENPANPNPDTVVRWGPQTFDEMMLGYVEYIVPVGSKTSLAGGFDVEGLFKRIDTNSDNLIQQSEYARFMKVAPRFKDKPEEAENLFKLLDSDKDGSLSLKEFKVILLVIRGR